MINVEVDYVIRENIVDLSGFSLDGKMSEKHISQIRSLFVFAGAGKRLQGQTLVSVNADEVLNVIHICLDQICCFLSHATVKNSHYIDVVKFSYAPTEAFKINTIYRMNTVVFDS